jgi:hypothetical protein
LADPSWEYINRSQILVHECANWETEHYNSVLEKRGYAVSFLEIHKLEPDIYIGFSPALYLQCRLRMGGVLSLPLL